MSRFVTPNALDPRTVEEMTMDIGAASKRRGFLVCSVMLLAAAGACALADSGRKQSAPPAANRPLAVAYTEIGSSVTIIGALGHPLGDYLKLEGKRVGPAKQPTKTGPGNFVVEKVNDKALDAPITLWFDKVATFPPGTACVIEGYETGEMVGVSEDVVRRTGGVAPQTGWQFRVHFVELKVTSHIP